MLIARTHHDRGTRVSLERLVLAGAPLLLQLLSGQLVLRQVAIRALEHTNAATARTERRHSGQRQGHRRASPRTKHTACRPRSRDSRSTKACDPRRRLRAPGAFVSHGLCAGNTKLRPSKISGFGPHESLSLLFPGNTLETPVDSGLSAPLGSW